MDFKQMIEKIMPEVESGGTEPFMVYRDADGGWHGDFTRDQYGDPFGWTEDVKDPFSMIFTGKEFAKGSYPYVYDYILKNRLRGENETASFPYADPGELDALINLFEDSTGELSPETTDYLATLERPLAALYDMTPISLVTDNPDLAYDPDKTLEFAEAVEAHISGLLQNREKRGPQNELETRTLEGEKPNKRVIDGYEEKYSVQLAGQLVILAENPKSDEPYMVCLCKWDNPLGIAEYYSIITTGDYAAAMRQYASGIMSFADAIHEERAGYGKPQTLTAADCIYGSLNGNLEGKVIVIKPEALSPEYRISEHQLKHCTGGFGAAENARGTAVFCEDLFSGKTSRFERYDVAGVIDPAKMPEWAKQKLASREALKGPGAAGPPVKAKAADKAADKKKPSVLGRLDGAKAEAAAYNADTARRGDVPKDKKRAGLGD